VRAANGELRERSVQQLSGGEKKRAALALALAFTQVAAARGRLSTNLLVLDEVRWWGGRGEAVGFGRLCFSVCSVRLATVAPAPSRQSWW